MMGFRSCTVIRVNSSGRSRENASNCAATADIWASIACRGPRRIAAGDSFDDGAVFAESCSIAAGRRHQQAAHPFEVLAQAIEQFAAASKAEMRG